MNAIQKYLVWGTAIALYSFIAQIAYASEPDVKVIPSAETARVGTPYAVAFVVSWEGKPDEYTVFPAECDALGKGEVTLAGMETRMKPGSVCEVVQRIAVTAEAPGTFELPAVRIGYSSKAALAESIVAAAKAEEEAAQAAQEQAAQAQAQVMQAMQAQQQAAAPPAAPAAPMKVSMPVGPSPALYLKAAPVAIAVHGARKVGPAGYGIAAVVVVLAAVNIGYFLARRKRRGAASEPVLTPAEQVRDLMHVARKCRLDGDFYGYYQALIGVMELVEGEASAELRGRFGARAKAIGFQGLRPSEDELEGDWRAVEREVKTWQVGAGVGVA